MTSPTPEHASKAVDRFVFFSDAVFAFALTLQAITLKLPSHDGKVPNAELTRALYDTLPALACYALSFVVVGLQWARHHRMFEKLRDYDTPVIALNFGLLFVISLFPLVIQLVTSAEDVRLPYAIYGGLAGVLGVVALALWWHLQRTPGLLYETLTGVAFRRELIRQLSLPVAGFGMLVAFLALPREQGPYALVGLAIVLAVSRARRWQ